MSGPTINMEAVRLGLAEDGENDGGQTSRPVIHVVDSFGVGGCQTCLKGLADYRGKNRRHLFVALRTVERPLRILGPFVVTIRSKSRFSLVPLVILLRLMRSTGPVILHCHLFRAQSFGLLLKILRPKSVLIFHERGRIHGREHEPHWENLLFRFLLGMSRPYVDVYLANSSHTLAKLEESGLRGRLPSRVIYNGIIKQIAKPSAGEQSAARARLGIPPNGFVIGFAGRLVERKGWRDFIEVAGCFAEYKDIYWLLAGDGRDGNEVLAAINESRNPRVRAIGEMLDLTEFFRSLDCCIVPSHWEPHGLVQIESISFGIPVIASDLPSMRETLQENVDSLLYKSRDTDALAKCVTTLLLSHELQTRLSEGAIRNAQRFTVVRYNEQLELCYRDLWNSLYRVQGAPRSL